MSDELALFAVLCLIYVTDCFLLVGRQSVAFSTGFGRGWRVASAEAFIGTLKSGLLLLNPLPPLGQVLCSHLPPWSLSPLGFCPVNGQIFFQSGQPDPEALAMAYGEVATVSTRDRDLYVNEEVFCRFGEPRQARRAARMITDLRDRVEADREAHIRAYWHEQFDFEAAQDRFGAGLGPEIDGSGRPARSCSCTCLWRLPWRSCIFTSRCCSYPWPGACS